VLLLRRPFDQQMS